MGFDNRDDRKSEHTHTHTHGIEGKKWFGGDGFTAISPFFMGLDPLRAVGDSAFAWHRFMGKYHSAQGGRPIPRTKMCDEVTMRDRGSQRHGGVELSCPVC